MRSAVVITVVLTLGVGPVSAHEGTIVDLKKAAADHQVEAVAYCAGTYEVKLKDGSKRAFREFDLRFKTDSGPNGPRPGTPVLTKAGMAGDRAFLIFSGPDELKDFLKRGC